MKNTRNNYTAKLLPRYFKNIGLIILIIELLVVLGTILWWRDSINKNIFEPILQITTLVALGIIALSKDRIEDERLMQIRLVSFMAAVFGATASFIITKIFYLFDSTTETTTFSTIFMLYMLYFLIFWLQKRKQ